MPKEKRNYKVSSNLEIGSARIGFRNFSGKEGKYNPKGRRNFCVFLDDKALVKELENDGWNVRYLMPREEDDDPQAYLQVTVSFKNFPPKVEMMTRKNKVILDEGTIDSLDWADIENIDLVLRPYNWGPINGKSGVKAYLKSAYVMVIEDQFAAKYRDYPFNDEDDDEPV